MSNFVTYPGPLTKVSFKYGLKSTSLRSEAPKILIPGAFFWGPKKAVVAGGPNLGNMVRK